MSSPPIKDLYKKLGKKLKDEEKKASQNAEDKLRNYYEDELNKNYFLSPEIKQQFLQLQNSKYIDNSKLQEKIFKKPRFLGKKDYFQSLSLDLLSYCISWSRIEGEPFYLTEETMSEFTQTYPLWKDATYQEISQLLTLLVESDLAIGDNIDGYWFEDQNDSKELRSILLLCNEKGMITISNVKQKLNWNISKINRLLDILITQEILIVDDDNSENLWILGTI